MNKKHIFLPVACVALLSACSLFPQEKKVLEVISPLSPFEESLQLDTEHIANFRLHGMTKTGEESIYLKEKNTVRDAYNAGDRSVNILRAYMYLSALEGDFDMKNTLETELCEIAPDTCQKSLVPVTVSGIVRDSLGKNLAGVVIELLGTKEQTLSDSQGKYSLTFTAHSPAVMRIRASSQRAMIGVKKIELVDGLRSGSPVQKFERNFTLITPFQTVDIDTSKKVIEGTGTSQNSSGYMITTPYTKYTIPFDAIVKNGKPYQGKLKAMVFEFDRASGTFLLDADAFDGIEGFATSLFVTYGMPFIIFTAEDGTRLDVLNSYPMYIATTMRERDENTSKPQFQDLYKLAFEESQKKPDQFPINNKWLFDHGNLHIMPSWWVFDRSTGLWDNVGKRFATDDPFSTYNVQAPFYTIFVGKR